MDSITHLALGACMGEVFAGNKLGNKAMIWGALAQSIPDIDFIASFWMDTSSNLLAHRGFTHSFLFAALITPVFSFFAGRWHRPHDISFLKWMLFFGPVIFAHIFLDAFNNYGVGWWEPFNHYRVSFNSIYVADPFFSAWPAIAIAIILVKKRDIVWNKRISSIGLLLCLVYVFYCVFNKFNIDNLVRHNLTEQHISERQYFTTPAPLQNWLWYIVASDGPGYYVGFHSLFERGDQIHFEFYNRNDSLLNETRDHEEVIKLKRFSKGYYTAERWGDTLIFNDLRFGQMIGWESPREKFVFHYYLDHSMKNNLVVQRGRFEGWNVKVVRNFIHRIFYD